MAHPPPNAEMELINFIPSRMLCLWTVEKEEEEEVGCAKWGKEDQESLLMLSLFSETRFGENTV